MIYAQKKNSDTYHSCVNCTQLPKKHELVDSAVKRPPQDKCNQCKSKERRGVGVPLELPA